MLGVLLGMMGETLDNAVGMLAKTQKSEHKLW